MKTPRLHLGSTNEYREYDEAKQCKSSKCNSYNCAAFIGAARLCIRVWSRAWFSKRGVSEPGIDGELNNYEAAEDETYTGHWVVLELLPMEVNGDWELLGMEPLVAEGLELETGTWAGKVVEFTIETGAGKVAVPTTGTEAGVVSQNVFAATLDA
ncbi:hypothetical protein WAI453_005302 [Rhynchosporium graminicola]